MSGGEFIFAFADVTANGKHVTPGMRFSFFFHTSMQQHINFTKNLGIYSGLALRNVGFVTKHGEYRAMRRSYTLGMPLALKVWRFQQAQLHVFWWRVRMAFPLPAQN
ncbi:MAG: hypothetical protein HC896_09545 [Bacteroidales bacterium]|nr:hypothetical protein [Bacteroidales bacterium]